MRALALVVVLACSVGLFAQPAAAQDAEALRKEIERAHSKPQEK